MSTMACRCSSSRRRGLGGRAAGSEFLVELGDAAFDAADLGVARTLRRRGSSWLRLEPTLAVFAELLAPRRKVRAVDAFASKQRAECTALGAGVRFAQDAQLLFAVEAPPLRLVFRGVRHDFLRRRARLRFRHLGVSGVRRRYSLLDGGRGSPHVGTQGLRRDTCDQINFRCTRRKHGNGHKTAAPPTKFPETSRHDRIFTHFTRQLRTSNSSLIFRMTAGLPIHPTVVILRR